MSDIQLVATDLDGTFLDDNKNIPDLNLAMLDDLYARGIQFVPCSGRPLEAIPKQLTEHPSCRWISCCNGAQIYDKKSKQFVYERRITNEQACAVAKALEDLPTTTDFVCDEGIITNKANRHIMENLPVDRRARSFSLSLRDFRETPTLELAATLPHIIRMGTFFLDPSIRADVLLAIAPIQGIEGTSSMPVNVEIACADATKGNSIAWIAQTAGIDLAQVVCFGDGENDASMLRVAGDGVAMQTAAPGAIAAANHRALSNNQAGVGAYLAQLLGIETDIDTSQD